MSSEALMPASAQPPSDAQRTFVRYFTAILIDLVVLSLFAEYWNKVHVDSFTTALLAAILLQVLLKLTIALEHRVAAPFKGKPGAMNTFWRFFLAWLVLFGSKFVILEALTFAFGDKVKFDGILHGIIPLIIVLVVMLVAEEAIVRLYRKLGGTEADAGTALHAAGSA
jgi:hypothetical protein